MMLSFAIFVPLIGALAMVLVPLRSERLIRSAGALVAAVPLALLIFGWLAFDVNGERFQLITDVPWIPSIGAGYRLGVDGISLTIASLSALLFVVAACYPTDLRGKARQYFAWILFLESACLGFFLALDLLLFYVFFDLSLVGMYFLIGVWGHEDRERAALKFILFTLAGSLVMLLGILSLALAMDPVSFDMRSIMAAQPLSATGLRSDLTVLALLFGLAVKTPLVPLHTWLPAAHVEAPAPASALLAGVLLKMGTYGMIRVAWEMLREPFAEWAWLLAIVAVVSIVYGAFVALGQRHIKRRIAYTSITHMGYTVLGIAVAASAFSQRVDARRLALNGAALEMIAHGLITGSLFLLAGSIYRRGESFSMDAYGGVARTAPWLTVTFGVAAFASLGLPALAGFVAEVQIFSGAVVLAPWLAGISLLGVLLTAALFLQLLHALFLGAPGDRSPRITDLGTLEVIAVAALLGLTVVIGIVPAFVIDPIDAATRVILGAD